MAIEALDCLENDETPEYIHTIAHDLESLYYVLLWICIYYSGPRNQARVLKTPIKTDQWYKASPTVLADIKRGQMNNIKGTLKLVDPYFKDIMDVLLNYHTALWSRPDMSDDDRRSLVHSTVTHDDIIDILMEGIRKLVGAEEAKLKRPRSNS